MRRFCVLGVLALLSACATYQRDNVPAAESAYKLAVDRCNAGAVQVHSFHEGMECLIEADRQFAVAIRLRDMSMFDNYAARLRLLASDVEAGKIEGKPIGDRYIAIRTDYFTEIEAAQENGRRRAEAFAAGMAAAGQSMQREADRQAYIQAHQQRPFNCTSTAFGSSVQTNCQ